MAVQLFAKTQGSTQYQLLDLFQAEPIKLTLSVANIIDPLAANSVFSRTFRVPHTANNAPFFKAAFNVNSTNFDASKKADAYINDNGVFFSVGNIRLSSIFVNEETNNIEYEINYYGETSDFGSKIGGGFLNQVDLSQYNHALTYGNVSNSWNGALLNGNVVYPLIEWGYLYNSSGVPSDPSLPEQGTLSKGGVRSFIFNTANTTKCIDYKQLKPTLKAKALWDAIFDESGYTYESTFLETDNLFTNLYVVADDIARNSVNANLEFSANDSYDSNILGANGPTSFVGAPAILMNFTTELYDPSNSYNEATSTYTAQAAGITTFEVSGYLEGIWPGFNTSAVLFSIEDVNTGMGLGSTSPVFVVPSNYTNFTKTLTATLQVGQQVRLRATCLNTVGSNTAYIQFSGCTFGVTSAPNIVSMSSFMPANIRKIDFMRSIINRFRLVFVPSKEKEKHFEITPWKDWILGGSTRDWTSKLDGSKDMKITPLFYGQDRLQVFKDQEDADFVNYNYQLDYKQTYGQKNLDSNNELIKGTKTYMDQFAPLPLYPIGGVDPTDVEYGFLIPHIAKDTNTERQPIQPKLRLGYYNGLQPAPLDTGLSWWIFTGSGLPIPKTNYPLMSQFSTWPVTSNTYDLNWENEPPTYDTTQSGLSLNQTNYDTFNVFWKTWYDTTFDPYSRIVEANFVLGYDDIIDLNFNDYIYVKDSWYLVNKITDYVIGEETNCRVELVKVGGNIGLVIPPDVIPFKGVDLCYSTTVCGAYCCTAQVAQSNVVYIDGVDLSSSSYVYADIFGQTNVANGYYSDGIVVADVQNGAIVQFMNTASCDCSPAAIYTFNVCRTDTSCDACCCTEYNTTIYGTNPDLDQNLYLWSDISLTSPAADGWYTESGSTVALKLTNGQTDVLALCSTCDCDPVQIYEWQVKLSEESPCDACCTGVTTTIWTDSATFTGSTVVWIDNVPLTLSGAAWYALGDDILVVDASGNVTAIGTCTSCSCLNYYVAENCEQPGLYANLSYPTPLSIGTVVSSLDYVGQCWTIIDLASDGLPINATYTTCAECLPQPSCTCYEYNVNSIIGGAISYIDCSTGNVVYMDVAQDSSIDLCACQDSIIVIAGKVKVFPLQPCDVPEANFFVLGDFEEYDGVGTNSIALLNANGNGIPLSFQSADFLTGGLGTPTTQPTAILRVEDGIWAAGQFQTYDPNPAAGLVKLTNSGTIDSIYDPSTGFINSSPYNSGPTSIARFSDGALVISGNFNEFKGTACSQDIICIQPDGTLDPSFNAGLGFTSSDIYMTFKKSKIVNDIWYGYTDSTALVNYNNQSGSRFCSINRFGQKVANFGLGGTGVGNLFDFDVDNLGRVYVTYADDATDTIYIKRWLPSGAQDPNYYFEFSPGVIAPGGPAPYPIEPSIYVNDSYECFIFCSGFLFKVTANQQLDPIFGVNQTVCTNALPNNSFMIGLENNQIYLSTYQYYVAGNRPTYEYNGVPVGLLFKINGTNGQLDPSFNNAYVPVETQNVSLWATSF